jgi:hypothetical protein
MSFGVSSPVSSSDDGWVSVSVSGSPSVLASPPAARGRRSSWRDPRLAVGLLLVFGSVLAGARVLAGADDTVAVLAAGTPLAAGERVEDGDLTAVRVRFASESDADRYLPGDAAPPEGAVLLRPVGAGELVPRAAVGGLAGEALAELPLALDPGRVPTGVRPGTRVDVWVGDGAGAADELLTDVDVICFVLG